MGLLGDLRFMRERGGEAAAKARFLKGAAAIGLAAAALAATAHLAYAGTAGTRPMCPERCAEYMRIAPFLWLAEVGAAAVAIWAGLHFTVVWRIMPVTFGPVVEAEVLDTRTGYRFGEGVEHRVHILVPFRDGARKVRLNTSKAQDAWDRKLLPGDRLPVALHPSGPAYAVLLKGMEAHACETERRSWVADLIRDRCAYLDARPKLSRKTLWKGLSRPSPEPPSLLAEDNAALDRFIRQGRSG